MKANSKISTKEKIFNVSLDLFSEKGYNEVSVREIAKKVGIKESSIYNHYSKKEDILNSIFDYFISNMNDTEISPEQMEKLLNKSPMSLYHFGSESVKHQFTQIKMIKILRLIFIEIYHNDKIKEFFLKEMIQNPISFWTSFFQDLIDKKIIKKNNPQKLAENYYYYGMFKMFEAIVLNYPEDPEKIETEKIFNDIEEHFDFIIRAIAIKQFKKH